MSVISDERMSGCYWAVAGIFLVFAGKLTVSPKIVPEASVRLFLTVLWLAVAGLSAFAAVKL